MWDRLRREERGFTLIELMVTTMIMITVLFALYSIFDMSIRVFSFGNDKVEAVENARLGLEKMEREIRAAYPYNKAAGQAHLLWEPDNPMVGIVPATGANQITFGNNKNDDYVVDADETITYRLNSGCTASGAGAVCTLQRVSPVDGQPQPVVEYVDGVTGLKFTPLTTSEGTPSSPDQVAKVRIDLAIEVDEGTQTLTTEVALRNRSN